MTNESTLDELQSLIARHADPILARPHLPGLIVAASSRPTPLRPYMAEPVLSLVAQGTKRVLLGDQVYDCLPGQYLVVSVDLPVSGHLTKATTKKPFLGISLTLKADAITKLLLETGLTWDSQSEAPGIAVSDAPPDLLDPVVRLLRLLDRPADIPVLSSAIEREILWRLVNGERAAMVRQFGLADSRLAQISHAVRWIREHYAESLRVDDLAELAGMSVTSFHRHFLRVTSLSPLQYQKQIRLQEARLRLLSSSQSVATVGFAVGYDSPSQFSREYRRMFGVPPGQDGTRPPELDEA